MPYHLKHHESLPDGMKRVVREELDTAIDMLRGKTKATRNDAIHEARKSIKKVRAVFRLLRDDLGAFYGRENARLRDAGRTLSEIRDADALIESFDKVMENFHKGLSRPARRSIRRALQAHKSRLEEEKALSRLLPQIADSLAKTRKEVKNRKLGRHGFTAIDDAFEKTFKRGRKALAIVEQGGQSEEFHELRKRVKDHWYHVRLLDRVWPDFMEGYEKSLKTLETQLGDDHNLVVLHDVVGASPATFGKDADIESLFDNVRSLQKKLREEALVTARRVYQESPHRLTMRVGHLWGIWKKSA